ncbi:MAG: hypothetical protein RI567_02190, partial [Marinobacter sp.]|nr:hypothetical protein [Marinobacter sp.]
IWKQRPLLGTGDNHQEALDQLLDLKSANPELRGYNPPHYHSQYFDLLAKKGALGLIIFATLATAIVLFILRREDTPTKWASLSAMVLYLLAGITDVPFRHPETVFLLLTAIVILLQPKTSIRIIKPCPEPKPPSMTLNLKPNR